MRLLILFFVGIVALAESCSSDMKISTQNFQPKCVETNSCVTTSNNTNTHATPAAEQDFGIQFDRNEYQTLSIKRIIVSSLQLTSGEPLTIGINSRSVSAIAQFGLSSPFSALAGITQFVSFEDNSAVLNSLGYGTNKLSLNLFTNSGTSVNVSTQEVTLTDFNIFTTTSLGLPTGTDDNNYHFVGWIEPISGSVYSGNDALATGFGNIIIQ